MNIFKIEIGFSNGQSIATEFYRDGAKQAAQNFAQMIETRARLLNNPLISKGLSRRSDLMPKRSFTLNIFCAGELVRSAIFGLKFRSNTLELDKETGSIPFVPAIVEEMMNSIKPVLEAGEPLERGLKFVPMGTDFNPMYLSLKAKSKPKKEEQKPLAVVAATLDHKAKAKKADNPDYQAKKKAKAKAKAEAAKAKA